MRVGGWDVGQDRAVRCRALPELSSRLALAACHPAQPLTGKSPPRHLQAGIQIARARGLRTIKWNCNCHCNEPNVRTTAHLPSQCAASGGALCAWWSAGGRQYYVVCRPWRPGSCMAPGQSSRSHPRGAAAFLVCRHAQSAVVDLSSPLCAWRPNAQTPPAHSQERGAVSYVCVWCVVLWLAALICVRVGVGCID